MSFRILERQMVALGRQTQAAFRDKMETYLRTHWPGFVVQVGEHRLAGWVAGALAVAHAHGIHTEPEVAQLMLLLTELGLDADQRLAWVRDVLDDRDLIATGKLAKLISEGCERTPTLAALVVVPAYQPVLDRMERA